MNMQTQLVKIKDLKNNTGQINGLPKNPRILKDDKFIKLKKSLEDDPEMLELREVIAYDNNGELIVICGNMRLKALKELGIKEVPTKILPIETSVEKLKAYTIKDNVSFGDHDWDVLANEWDAEQLDAWGLDVPDFAVEEIEAEEDDFDATPPINPITVLGDLYEIGEHRLLCGDSTDSDQVAKLMNGEKADMVFTDPPYGMSYKGTTFGKEGLENDGDDEWENVLQGAFQNMILFTQNSVFALCFSPSRLNRFFRCTEGINFKRILTIYKPNRMGFPWQSWILTSEIIALFENGKPEYIKENYKHDVYTFDYSERPDKEVNHPTVKPLSIVCDVISKTKGKSVLDLFLGSGTTMVASHQLKRKCYGMELDPKYADVIVKRMIKLDPKLTIKLNGKDVTKEWVKTEN
jgi:site-specific DNA-methyltransferase (adenine-specific)